MKKILFLTQLPPPVHGASVVNLSIKESRLINESFVTEHLNISPANGIGDIGRFNYAKAVKTIKIFFSCIKAAIKSNPDLVYCTMSPHGPAFIKDSLIIVAMKLLRRNIVVHLHGKGIKETYSKSNAFLRWYYRMVFNKLSVIHLSESLLKDIDIFENLKHVAVINNGVQDHTTNIEKSKDSGARDKIKVVYLSNFIREKGALDLLKSLDSLYEYKDELEIVLAGKFFDDDFKKDIYNQIQKLDQFDVKILEGVYGKDKEILFNNSDVFVLPTYYKNECFPLTLLEAMSHELCLLATKEGAIPDILDNSSNGYFIESNNPESIAIKLKLLLKDRRSLAEFKKQSRKKFIEKYTLTTFEKNMLSVLNELMER